MRSSFRLQSDLFRNSPMYLRLHRRLKDRSRDSNIVISVIAEGEDSADDDDDDDDDDEGIVDANEGDSKTFISSSKYLSRNPIDLSLSTLI